MATVSVSDSTQVTVVKNQTIIAHGSLHRPSGNHWTACVVTVQIQGSGTVTIKGENDTTITPGQLYTNLSLFRITEHQGITPIVTLSTTSTTSLTVTVIFTCQYTTNTLVTAGNKIEASLISDQTYVTVTSGNKMKASDLGGTSGEKITAAMVNSFLDNS